MVRLAISVVLASLSACSLSTRSSSDLPLFLVLLLFGQHVGMGVGSAALV